MKSHSSNPEFCNKKHRRLYRAGLHSTSAFQIPLRHSSKSRNLVYYNLRASSSHRKTISLTLAERQRQDLTNPEYHLLYGLIGSRFYASCPEFIDAHDDGKGEFKSPSTTSTFYQVKSRSTWGTQAPEGRPRSRISKIARSVSSYLSACIGTPGCFRE